MNRMQEKLLAQRLSSSMLRHQLQRGEGEGWGEVVYDTSKGLILLYACILNACLQKGEMKH